MDAAQKGKRGATRQLTPALLVLLVLLVSSAPAQAYIEDEAPKVRLAQSGKDDVVRLWHEPEIVEPGTQWRGYLQFRPGHSIEDVKGFQVCDVGRSCFAPPTPLHRLNETTWMFDTAEYIAGGAGKPVDYEAGMRLGTRFILIERHANGTLVESVFPEAGDNADLEFHYFAFDMPEAPRRAPGAGAALIILVLAGLSWRLRT